MADSIRIAVAQLNPHVGDCAGNARGILAALGSADRRGARLLVTPELSVPGYLPEDLLLRRDFIAANLAGLDAVVAGSRRHPKVRLAVGYVEPDGERLFNAAAIVRAGRIEGVYRKSLLPNYGVFDERRYFTPGDAAVAFQFDGMPVAVTICEDVWHPDGAAMRAVARSGAKLVINLSASPYEMGKIRVREDLIAPQARRLGAPLVYANRVGGQDEIVFDGQSMVFDARGRVIARGRPFDEELLVLEVPLGRGGDRRRPVPRAPEPLAEVWGALVCGIRDYARRNGFTGAVLGLSGGVDSALVAALAADALGDGQVTVAYLPSRYSAAESRTGARKLADRLGLNWIELPIEPVHRAYQGTLNVHLEGPDADLARQNLQSRIRGALLMALSNRHGWLLLATGNKSEMSCGYATLYGDLAGGFAPIKDVPKTLVWKLARWKNTHDRRRPIPARTISRPPTAELKPGQRDTDSLPPYPVLDRILEAYIEGGASPADIVRKTRYSRAVVARVVRMVDRAEYKRRQAPPGVKIRPRAFGKDRRNPITHGFRPV